MFQVNDYVMYGSVGVCRVEEICKPGNGVDSLHYVLQPVFAKNSTIYTPVDNTKVSIRKVMSKDEAHSLIDKMSDVEPYNISNRREKEVEYKRALKSGEHVEWARLVKTLYNKKKENVSYRQIFSETDRTLLCSAEKLLNGELSIALQMPFEKVGDFISSKFQMSGA